MALTKKDEKIILKDITYQVTDAEVSLSKDAGGEIMLSFTIEGETKQSKVDDELSAIRLYQNESFHTGVWDIKDLKGKKFVWNGEKNTSGEAAGLIFIVEHDSITDSVIEILSATEKYVSVRWSGHANVNWNRKYGTDVPFEAVFKGKVRGNAFYVWPYKSPIVRVDQDTVIEVLNLDDYYLPPDVLETVWLDISYSRGREIDWENTPLRFKVTCGKTEYLGHTDFLKGKVWRKTYLDPACPRRFVMRVIAISNFIMTDNFVLFNEEGVDPQDDGFNSYFSDPKNKKEQEENVSD